MSDSALPSVAGQRTAFFKHRSTGWIAASLLVLGLVAALVVVSVAPAAAVADRTIYGTDSGQITPSLGGVRNAAVFGWVGPQALWQRAISRQISSGAFGSSSVYVPYKQVKNPIVTGTTRREGRSAFRRSCRASARPGRCRPR
jgi:hypothetical protein